MAECDEPQAGRRADRGSGELRSEQHLRTGMCQLSSPAETSM